MAITIWDVAVARGVVIKNDGSISAGEFDRLKLPFFCGCQGCEASMGPVQAHPSQTGYTRCKDCIGDLGFETVEEFETWDEEN